MVQQLNPSSESSLTLFAVVTVPAGGVVSTVQADAAALAARQFVQLIVEATLASVQIAIAGWRKKRKRKKKEVNVSLVVALDAMLLLLMMIMMSPVISTREERDGDDNCGCCHKLLLFRLFIFSCCLLGVLFVIYCCCYCTLSLSMFVCVYLSSLFLPFFLFSPFDQADRKAAATSINWCCN